MSKPLFCKSSWSRFDRHMTFLGRWQWTIVILALTDQAWRELLSDWKVGPRHGRFHSLSIPCIIPPCPQLIKSAKAEPSGESVWRNFLPSVLPEFLVSILGNPRTPVSVTFTFLDILWLFQFYVVRVSILFILTFFIRTIYHIQSIYILVNNNSLCK